MRPTVYFRQAKDGEWKAFGRSVSVRKVVGKFKDGWTAQQVADEFTIHPPIPGGDARRCRRPANTVTPKP